MATIKKPKGTLSIQPKKSGWKEPEVFKLTTTKSTPVAVLGGYCMLLYGERKIGKTSMLSYAPRAYFMMFEPGAKALSVYQDSYVRWSQVKAGIKQLIDDPRFDTVIIDIVDKMFRLCEVYVCKKLGVDHVSDADWGKGWSALREEFESEILRLLQSGKGVVFVSHATEKELRVRGGDAYDMITSTMPKMAREMIEGLVDIWAYYGYVGKRRQLWIRGSDSVTAGHRLKNHFQHNGHDLDVIHMGASEKEAWINFESAFHNRYAPPAEPAEEVRPAVKKILKRRV